jgi:hypothetical protein
MHTYRINPETPRGYPLSARIGVIVPQATTNYAINPSAERDLTGWSGTNATIARTTAWQRRGAYGISVTPTASTGTRGINYSVLAPALATVATASIDFRGVAGLVYRLQIDDGANPITLDWTAAGRDQRIALTAPNGISFGGAVVSLLMISNGTQPFYVDGLQVEALGEATTYVDGDLVGFIRNQADFYWTGAPHASASVRTAATRAGGRIVMLDSIGFSLLSIIGLSMAPILPIATPLATGGAYYQTTVPQVRDFNLTGDLYAASPQHLVTQQHALRSAVSPFVTPQPQPLVLTYQDYDPCGRPISEPCEITCHYTEGLGGLRDNNHQERASLGFRMFLPLISKEGERAASLSPQQTVTTTDILQRSRTGDWAVLGTGTTGGFVRSVVVHPQGGIYAGGTFTLAGGVANTVKIARWDGAAWTALGTGATGGDVYDLAIAPNGDLIAAGTFTSMGGVANTARIARWNGIVWAPLGTGMNADVFAVAFAPNGTLYAGGDFTTAGGGAAARIASWDGSAWSALGAGANSTVLALTVAPDGTLYLGGDFTTMDGVSAARIASWDGTTAEALAAGLDSTVRALLVGPGGLLYAAGGFTTSGSTALTSIGAWNGSQWQPLGDGIGLFNGGLALDPAGNLYSSGAAVGSGLGSVTGYSVWTGTAWIPSEISAPSMSNLDLVFTPDGTLYAGGSFTSPATTADLTTVTAEGSGPAAPIITINGPSSGAATLYQIINTTTGAAIYFDTLTISAGEVMTLTLTPTNISFISTFQGNILGRILPISTLAGWQLRPGPNTVSFYASSSTVTATIRWRDQYGWIEDAGYR